MVFCDTHIHLLAPEWIEPAQRRIETAADSGIELLLQPGVRSGDWDKLIDLAQRHQTVYAAPGLHPMSAAEWNASRSARLRELCCLSEVIALGEIGLDALLDVDPQLQEQAFSGQVEIAIAAGLPVLIHCRKKIGQVLGILRQSGVGKVGGILHGFSGSVETARQATELGLLVGVGPVLLRENTRRLPEVVKAIPAAALVLETDAPDMATGPEVLIEVAEKVAELRGWTLAETAKITTANARRILKL